MISKALYITSSEVGAGSLVVGMGVMNTLKKLYSKIAFYRPIIASRDQEDSYIRFMIDHFDLDIDYNDAYSFSLDELAATIVKYGKEAAIQQVIEKFNELTKKYDFVLIEGFHHSQLTAILDSDINLTIAKNLNAPTLIVTSGKDKCADTIVYEAKAQKIALQKNICNEFGIFVNRVSDSMMPTLKERFSDVPNVFLMPESKELETPTIRAVKDGLNCELLAGTEAMLDKHFNDISIAAMDIERYLERVKNDDLVVVPGDRVGILLASLVSYYSKEAPRIAGILLSGGIKPSQKILNMIQEFHEIPIPIMVAETGTYATVREIEKLPSKITAKNEQKIALALKLFDKCIEGRNFYAKFTQELENVVMTPTMFEFNLFERARANKKTIILDETEDDRILKAAATLLRLDVVNIVLLGVENDILAKAQSLDLDISKATIINPTTSSYKEQFIKEFYELRKAKGMTLEGAAEAVSKGAYFATMMIQCGLADGMVSGATHTTADTIRPALQIFKTKPGISIVSSVFFMCLDTKVLVFGDCAVIPNPSDKELAEIAISAAETAIAFGIEPKVALLSYSTGSSGSGPDVDVVKSAVAIAQQARPDLLIEGPMQYDAATDPSVGKSKAPNSKVAGEANVLVFPDLNSGNIGYKA
ncbi:MAG: hypothetical protein RL154_1209, partial [Pseudomonadota bacterium]